MALVRPRSEDDPRPPPPNSIDDLHLFVAAGAQTAVAEVQLLAEGGAEDIRCFEGFRATDFRGAAGAHLAPGQIDNADFAAGAHEIDDRAAAAELDVIRVRAEKDRINRFGHHKLT